MGGIEIQFDDRAGAVELGARRLARDVTQRQLQLREREIGCLVERASGMTLDAFVRSRITGPLGMKDTQFFLPPDQRDRLAAVYSLGIDGKIARAPDGPRGQGAYVEGPRRSGRRSFIRPKVAF